MPPSPPPLSSSPRSPPSSSTQSRAGERDPPPARPATGLTRRRLPALGRAHTLPLGSNLQASMAGCSPRVAGRCGGLGAQAVVCGYSGQLPAGLWVARSRRSEGSELGAPRVPTAATALGAGDPQQCGAAPATRRAALAPLPLFLSLSLLPSFFLSFILPFLLFCFCEFIFYCFIFIWGCCWFIVVVLLLLFLDRVSLCSPD